MQYKLKITTDDGFDIEYGKNTKYGDGISIIFNVKSKYDPKKILKILDKIEILERFDKDHYRGAQTTFSNLKKAIKNGDKYFHFETTYSNYSFTFDQVEENIVDYIVNI